MSESGSLNEYTPSVDEMVRALSYWGSMTREEARAAVNRRLDFIKASALRDVVESRAISIPDVLGYKVPAVTVEDLLTEADEIEAEARP